MANSYLVEVDGVRLSGDPHAALSFQCQPGELIGLLGPPGSGKSALLDVLDGLAQPVSGSVEICGTHPARMSNPQKRDVGFVFQQCALPVHMRVRQMLSLLWGMVPSDDSDLNLIDQLGLSDALDCVVGDLSAALRQCLSVYLALHGRRRVWIMDEPTAALNHSQRRLIWDCMLSKQRRHGIGGVIASSNGLEVAALCQRVYWMDRGRIIGEAAADMLLGHRSMSKSGAFASDYARPQQAIQRDTQQQLEAA